MIEDASVWARETKMSEGLICMYPESEEFFAPKYEPSPFVVLKQSQKSSN